MKVRLVAESLNESAYAKLNEEISKWRVKDDSGKELYFVNQTYFSIQVPPYLDPKNFEKSESKEYKECEKKSLNILDKGGYAKFKWTFNKKNSGNNIYNENIFEKIRELFKLSKTKIILS